MGQSKTLNHWFDYFLGFRLDKTNQPYIFFSLFETQYIHLRAFIQASMEIC